MRDAHVGHHFRYDREWLYGGRIVIVGCSTVQRHLTVVTGLQLVVHEYVSV